MTFDLLYLLLAFGGGFFAAAIRGLHAIIINRIMVLARHPNKQAGGSSD